MEQEVFKKMLQEYIRGNLGKSEKNQLAAFIGKKPNKEVVISTLEEFLSLEAGGNEFDEKHHMPLIKGILSAETVKDEEENDDSSDGKNSLLRKLRGKMGW